MKQRYQLRHNDEKNQLILSEYMEWEGIYALMCEETYPADVIHKAKEAGMTALINAIRTPNMYPFNQLSRNIAEGVIRLYDPQKEPVPEVNIDWEDIEESRKLLLEGEESEGIDEPLTDLTDDLTEEDLDDTFLDDDDLNGIVASGSTSVDEDIVEEEDI